MRCYDAAANSVTLCNRNFKGFKLNAGTVHIEDMELQVIG